MPISPRMGSLSPSRRSHLPNPAPGHGRGGTGAVPGARNSPSRAPRSPAAAGHPPPLHSTHPFSFPSGFHPVSPGRQGSTSPCLPHTSGRGRIEPSCQTALPHQKLAGLTDAGDALDGDLPHTLLEAGQARVDLADLRLLPLNQLLDDLQQEGEVGSGEVSRDCRILRGAKP